MSRILVIFHPVQLVYVPRLMDALKFLSPDTGKRYFYSLTQNCVPASAHSHKSQCNPGAIRMVCNAFRSHSGNCVFSGELRAVWFPLDWRKLSNVHRTTNVNSSVCRKNFFWYFSYEMENRNFCSFNENRASEMRDIVRNMRTDRLNILLLLLLGRSL